MPTTRPSASRAELRKTAHALLDASSLDPDLIPCAVGLVDPDGSGSALALRPLTGCHPIDGLLGFVAPAHWRAVGLVVRGVARPLPRTPAPGTSPCADEAATVVTAPTALCLVHLQPRRGPSLSLLDLDDRAGVEELTVDGAGGRVADACLRALGRRTTSPSGTAESLAEVVWVDRLLRALAGREHALLSCAEMRALHPMVSGPGNGADARDPHQTGPLVRLGSELGWPTRWRTWRRGLAAHDESVLGIDPDVAEWMDDGMFQRWVHSELPPLAGLVDDFAVLVPRSVLRDVLEVMSSLQTARPTSAGRSGALP